MTLSEFMNEVARKADTGKTQINAAETRRVLSEAFILLSKMKSADATNVIAKGIASGAKKKAK
ncbi:hypothetical protein Mal64_21210 [Pseudobythopirellula maris]|uniref:Uncharacterized protein n=1 Tax=Pseudobythopirellula maris TaxID=2527991 RepID=A0A5C5ZNI9_9BACT|nr:hypothetical protein [Pseudobythopirellula maris]TWT88635.1 hypothetical protein Mal64_21210 [Pseudobythopirellula maris]